MAEGFAAVPTWMIRDESVSARAILVYAALATRAGLRSNFPSQPTLEREARCTGKPLRAALRELEDLGVVERVRRVSKQGYRQTDGYRLLSRPIDENESLAGDIPGRGGPNGNLDPALAGDIPGSLLSIEVDRYEVDNPQTPTGGKEIESASQALDDAENEFETAFAAFYTIYPRKVGKATARGAFAKAARRASGFQVIVDGARRLAADPNLPEKQFIPHPSTWLNRDGWEDEPLPPRADRRVSAAEQMAAEFFSRSGGERHALSA